MLVTAEDFDQLFAAVQGINLGVLLDVGHLRVSAETLGSSPEKFARAVAPYVECLHLSNNDGVRDTHDPFDESAWFIPMLHAFKDRPMVVETRPLGGDERDAIQQALDKALDG